MAERTEMGIQTARDAFRTVVDNALVKREATVITRHGQPVAAVVPYSWYEEIVERHREDPRSSA